MSFSTGVQSVDALEHFNSEGNIIPSTWFKYFKMQNGKTDSIGIFLLSEIVYWHRPTIVRDELTGRIVGMRKKFKSDMLQRSYDSFVEQFDFTKDQVREALTRLENFGIITRHFRTIDVNGTKLSNVLFIELNAEMVMKVSTLSDYNPTPSPTGIRHPIGLESDTYTETTNTENTIHNKRKINEKKKPKVSEKTKAELEREENARKLSFEEAMVFADNQISHLCDMTLWSQYATSRSQTQRTRLTKNAINAIKKDFEEWGYADANNSLKTSIAGNYVGLFKPKGGYSKQQPEQPKRRFGSPMQNERQMKDVGSSS